MMRSALTFTTSILYERRKIDTYNNNKKYYDLELHG
jgi:hypothetical protein